MKSPLLLDNLATMLNAGLPLTDALNLLKLQSSSTILRPPSSDS